MKWPWRRRPTAQLDCRQVRRVVQTYLDGELPEGDAGLVAAHLELCERCGLDAATVEKVKVALRSLDRGVDEEALARLREFAAHVPDTA